MQIKKYILAEACGLLADELQKFVDSGYDMERIIKNADQGISVSGGICSVQAVLASADNGCNSTLYEYMKDVAKNYQNESCSGYEDEDDVIRSIRSALASRRDYIFSAWPHFSGHIGYPIEGTGETSAYDAFYECPDKFGTDAYAQKRRELVQYMIRMYRILAEGTGNLKLKHLTAMRSVLRTFVYECDFDPEKLLPENSQKWNMGICSVLNYASTEDCLDPAMYKLDPEWCEDRIFRSKTVLLDTIFKNWDEYSGYPSFPIPHPSGCSKSGFFLPPTNKFLGEYGETRKRCTMFMLQALSVLIRSY